jgi:hypothetical protein
MRNSSESMRHFKTRCREQASKGYGNEDVDGLARASIPAAGVLIIKLFDLQQVRLSTALSGKDHRAQVQPYEMTSKFILIF